VAMRASLKPSTSCRREAVEAENRLSIGVVDGKEGLGAAALVASPGVPFWKFVQRRFAAIASPRQPRPPGVPQSLPLRPRKVLARHRPHSGEQRLSAKLALLIIYDNILK
jgi:hypothetical protein